MVERIILEPGETVIFNNHRALHGRESFKVPINLLMSSLPRAQLSNLCQWESEVPIKMLDFKDTHRKCVEPAS